MSSSRGLRIPASVQDWFFVAIAPGHDRTVRLVLELDGRVDHPRLSRALTLLLQAEPVLRCRFVGRLFSAHWEERDDLDRRELCALVHTEDLQRDLHAFMAVSLDPERDPLLLVRVFRGTTDTVCIKLSHAAMDGGGFKLLTRRLTSLYRSLGSDPSSTLPPDLNLERGQGQVLGRFSFRDLLHAFLTQPFHKKTWSLPYVGRELADFSFASSTVGMSVSALREAARRRGASITDALVASFARAIFAATGTTSDRPVPFTLAMDLRRYLPVEEEAGLCNLSSLAWIDLPVPRAGVPIDETLAEVHAALDVAMQDNPGVGLAVVMEVVSVLGYKGFALANGARARLARRQGREFPSLSNIGVMDGKVLDFGDVAVRQSRFFGPVFFPPTFYLVTGTFNDSLYLSASYPASVMPPGMVERIFSLMAREIESLR